MQTLGQAATSGLGLTAVGFLVVAVFAAFGLRGRSRTTGIALSLVAAGVLGTAALNVVQPGSSPADEAQQHWN